MHPRNIFLGLAAMAALTLINAAALATPDVKSNSHVGLNAASDSREGGETIADAIPIPPGVWNWADSGATCDNLDDYDEICPFSGSTSPDVVYSYQYDGCKYITFDLYGSFYDTKIYIYDEQLNLLACNDDYYWDYTSCIDFFSDYSGLLYIVIDGYGGDCGLYMIVLYEMAGPPPPHYVECPTNAQLENEPPPADGYVDQFNGGCDAETPVFQQLFGGQGDLELDFCGELGWFTTDDVAMRDTDWFQVVADGQEILWTVDSQYYGTLCRRSGAVDCSEPVVILEEMVVGSGLVETMTIPTFPGEIITLWILPNQIEEPICFINPFEYVFHLSGVSGTVDVQPETWDGVKSLYR